MANAIDFLSTVYDFLAKTFNTNSVSTNVYLQMAWPGFSLSPSDFKLSAQPDGPYNPAVAERTFASIANIVPAFSTIKFENSGFEVSDIYELLIASAIPVGATQGDLDKFPLFKLFSDANFEYLNAKKGSVEDPNDFYYPCVATPNNWYDEAASATWQTINISSSEVKPESPSSTFVRAGGVNIANQGVWRLRPESINESAIKADMQKTLIARNAAINEKFKVTPNVIVKPMASNIAAAASKANIGITDASAMRTSTFVGNLNLARQSQIFAQKSGPTNALVSNKYQSILQAATLDKSNLALTTGRKVSLADSIMVNSVLNQQLPTKSVSNDTTGFSISFRVCRVNIDRHWFNLTLLNTKNWYMFGTAVGEYSTGSADANPGMFPFVPVSFMVISNLKITANWSQQDKETFSKSVSFGPFDIRNGTLNQNTIEVKGLQILGWISKLMPALPPAHV